MQVGQSLGTCCGGKALHGFQSQMNAPQNIELKSSPQSDKELGEMKEILWLVHENNLMDGMLENFPLRKALGVSACVARFERITCQGAHKVSGPLLPEEM